MSFSFGFGGDDIEEDEVDLDVNGAGGEQMNVDSKNIADVPGSSMKPIKLEVDDLLSGLPSSFRFHHHTIPAVYGSLESAIYHLRRYPRRDLDDIRAQIMSTADPSSVDAVHEAALSSSGDLSAGIYEGGFKTWECSNDLAWWMTERGPRDLSETIELGAGTALPSCVVLSAILRGDITAGGGKVMVIADYNEAVLRMCTFPNVFLTWYSTRREISKLKQTESSGKGQATEMNQSDDEVKDFFDDGYVEVTDELKQQFLNDMQALQIKLVFVAGSWGSDFSDLVKSELAWQGSEKGARYIMASETIYSPNTLPVFTQTVMDLLSPLPRQARAVIAAKRIYFGVGGGVDEFRRQLPVESVFEDQWEGEFGVGRWIGQLRYGG